jgi:uncharacterized protein (DUF433 family)
MEMNPAPTLTDERFTTPLYTRTEAARYLSVPASTFKTWTDGYERHSEGRGTVGAPVLTSIKPLQPGQRGPVVPFIGLAEGLVLAAIRRSGVPLQRIRPALARLKHDLGLPYALASQRLYTDGAEVLYDYARDDGDRESEALLNLVVVRSGQRVFNEVVESYLRLVSFGEDGYARLIQLPAYGVAEVVVDPTRGFGQPIFSHGGARLEDALAMFRAGEPLDVVADEYGVPGPELEDAVRVATLVAA